MPKATRKNMCLDLTKSRGYLSGDDVTWTGEDAPDHIWKWYQDMMLAEQYSLKRLLNEDAAHDIGSTVGDVLDLIQDIQEESEKSTGWGRFRGIGIEFIKIAMAEIPIVGGTLGAIDGLYAMYEAGKKEEHTWKDIEEYPILRRIKMHPQLLKVLDDMVLRRIDEAYKEYLATLGRDTLVSQITDIDIFTHKWIMEETEETIDVAVISELRQYIRTLVIEDVTDPGDPKHNRASDDGEWSGILDMIETGDIGRWRQALSLIETGIAQEWPEDAQLDLVHGMYEVIDGWENRHLRHIERNIEELQTNNKYGKEYTRLVNLENDLVQELNDIHKLVAELLDIPNSWYYEGNLGRDWSGWEDLFRKAGII